MGTYIYKASSLVDVAAHNVLDLKMSTLRLNIYKYI